MCETQKVITLEQWLQLYTAYQLIMGNNENIRGFMLT